MEHWNSVHQLVVETKSLVELELNDVVGTGSNHNLVDTADLNDTTKLSVYESWWP